MAGAFHKLRVTDATACVAQVAATTGEMVELKDRRGETHRGWVRYCHYEFGYDQGWIVWFQYRDDFTIRDVIAQHLRMQGNGNSTLTPRTRQQNRAARRRQQRNVSAAR